MINQYPYGYSGNPSEAADKMEIQRQDGYFYVNPDSGKKVSLEYSNGALHINTGILKEPVWTKNDSFINPVSKRKYGITAEASYSSEFKADEFLVSITEAETDTISGFIEGLVEDATVFFIDNSYRFTALEYWEPRIKREKADGKNVWSHYPFGASWSVEVNGIIVGEVLQGSPVVTRFGAKTNYGESFTFLFLEEIDTSQKTNLINAWMTYLALSDIDYYYYECDYYDSYDQDCPGSVVVR